MKEGAAVFRKSPRIGIEIVPGEMVARDWRLYRGMVDEALEYEREIWEHVDILQRIRAGTWLCLAVRFTGTLHGFCICEQRKAKKGWTLQVMLLAGVGLPLWVDELFDAVKTVAASHNCDSITVSGRLGWLRILKRYGFAPVAQTLIMEL